MGAPENTSLVLDILNAISGYSVFIPCIVCIILRNKIPPSYRNIVYFVWIATIGEIISRILYTFHFNGLPALHIYTFAEGVILLLFYHGLLNKKYKPTYLTLIIIIFSVFTVWNSAFIQSIYEVNSNARTLEASLIIVCAILYYFLLFELEDSFSLRTPLLWINNGIFLYFTASLLFFVFGNYLMQHYTTRFNTMIWRLHTIFLLIFHIILARGIWLLGRRVVS